MNDASAILLHPSSGSFNSLSVSGMERALLNTGNVNLGDHGLAPSQSLARASMDTAAVQRSANMSQQRRSFSDCYRPNSKVDILDLASSNNTQIDTLAEELDVQDHLGSPTSTDGGEKSLVSSLPKAGVHEVPQRPTSCTPLLCSCSTTEVCNMCSCLRLPSGARLLRTCLCMPFVTQDLKNLSGAADGFSSAPGAPPALQVPEQQTCCPCKQWFRMACF